MVEKIILMINSTRGIMSIRKTCASSINQPYLMAVMMYIDKCYALSSYYKITLKCHAINVDSSCSFLLSAAQCKRMEGIRTCSQPASTTLSPTHSTMAPTTSSVSPYLLAPDPSHLAPPRPDLCSRAPGKTSTDADSLHYTLFFVDSCFLY